VDDVKSPDVTRLLLDLPTSEPTRHSSTLWRYCLRMFGSPHSHRATEHAYPSRTLCHLTFTIKHRGRYLLTIAPRAPVQPIRYRLAAVVQTFAAALRSNVFIVLCRSYGPHNSDDVACAWTAVRLVQHAPLHSVLTRSVAGVPVSTQFWTVALTGSTISC